MTNLVWAEITTFSQDMRSDIHARVVSDTGLFLVTTPENAERYNHEEFFPLDEESAFIYRDQLQGLVEDLDE